MSWYCVTFYLGERGTRHLRIKAANKPSAINKGMIEARKQFSNYYAIKRVEAELDKGGSR